MAILENGYRKTLFSWDFTVVLNWAKRLKNCWTSGRCMPSPNAHWLGWCNRLRNLVGSEIWGHACVFSTTLLLPSTATCASWNSKCRCYQWKNKRPRPAEGKYRFIDSGLRSTPKRGWQIWVYVCLAVTCHLHFWWRVVGNGGHCTEEGKKKFNIFRCCTAQISTRAEAWAQF